jgi:COP9 signalosome complex subunit 6
VRVQTTPDWSSLVYLSLSNTDNIYTTTSTTTHQYCKVLSSPRPPADIHLSFATISSHHTPPIMAGKTATSNSLISSKPSDSPLAVQLHPLVLLTVSDYITRHTLRQQSGPIVGAIFGQQNGRNFTLEHAFECKLSDNDDAPLHSEWFLKRLEQYREVHKAPALDLVAMFMSSSADGPQPAHLPVLNHAQSLVGNDNLMLLLFQLDMVDKMEGGKLPIGLYEPYQEPVGEQSEMRFRELSFEVETGDAEMIGVDFVAKGGGNATAVQGIQTANADASARDKKAKGKAKSEAKDDKDDAESDGAATNVLSREDDELIASLTAKSNAIKMLNQRVNLIRSYLTSLPESYLTDASSTILPAEGTNFPLLRNVNSLMSRLPLLTPPAAAPATNGTTHEAPVSSLHQTASCEQQDVHLTSLLAALTRSVSETQTLASRFHSVQRERTMKDRNFNQPSYFGNERSSFVDSPGL